MITNLNDFRKNKLNENKTSKLIVEGSFGWLTQDTNEQIPSWKEFDVYMYDNKGNKWHETKYDSYGIFDGKDYYDLVAEMNGYSEEDVVTLGKTDLRDIGLDLAFDSLKPKNGGPVLFPALVTDPNLDITTHDFTQEANHDPNQSWESDDADEIDESIINENNSEDDLKRSLNFAAENGYISDASINSQEELLASIRTNLQPALTEFCASHNISPMTIKEVNIRNTLYFGAESEPVSGDALGIFKNAMKSANYYLFNKFSFKFMYLDYKGGAYAGQPFMFTNELWSTLSVGYEPIGGGSNGVSYSFSGHGNDDTMFYNVIEKKIYTR